MLLIKHSQSSSKVIFFNPNIFFVIHNWDYLSIGSLLRWKNENCQNWKHHSTVVQIWSTLFAIAFSDQTMTCLNKELVFIHRQPHLNINSRSYWVVSGDCHNSLNSLVSNLSILLLSLSIKQNLYSDNSYPQFYTKPLHNVLKNMYRKQYTQPNFLCFSYGCLSSAALLKGIP